MRRCLLALLLFACSADVAPLEHRIVLPDRPARTPPALWLLTDDGAIDFADADGVRTTASAATRVFEESFGGDANGAFALYRDPWSDQATTLVRVGSDLVTHTVTPEAGLVFGPIAPDGARAIVDRDGTSALYDVARGTLVPTAPVKTRAGIWSPDGKTLATEPKNNRDMLRLVLADGTNADFTAVGNPGYPAWNHASTELVWGSERLSVLGSNGVQSLELPPEHALIEVKWAGNDKNFFFRTFLPRASWGDGCLARREDGRWVTAWCNGAPLHAFAIAPDGRYVVMIHRTTQVRWILDTRTLDTRVTPGPTDSATSVRAAGDRFVAFGADGFVVFDHDAVLLDALDGTPATDARFDNTASWVAAHDGATVRLANVDGRDDLYPFGAVRRILWSWDGAWLVVLHDGTVTAIEAATRRIHPYGRDRVWTSVALAQ